MASVLTHLLLLCLFFLPFSLFAKNSGQVNVGTSLTAGDETEQPWISPSGDFAFGFHRLEKTDLYLLAIWYNKIPNTTIVWYVNGDKPAPKGSKLELTEDRGLVLSGPQGPELWRSEITTGQASHGLMNNTGNFMVKNSEAETLWESFEHPTDTLLPGQTLEKGGRILNSRLRETNFSTGSFQFRLINDGNGVLNFNNAPTGWAHDAYFWTETVDNNASNAGFQVVFNESGYLYVLRANGNRKAITPPGAVLSPENFYHRVILHFDGVLAQYSYPKSSTSSNDKWETVFKEPDDICNSITRIGTGPCGFNSLCKLNDDQRAACECPPQFSPINPNDEYGGCKPDFSTQFCETGEPYSPQDFEFIHLANTDWPTSDYEGYNPYSIEDCRNACLQDCLCNVIATKDSGCWKKKLPLSNGRQNPAVSARTYIKVRKGNSTRKVSPSIPFPTKTKNQDWLVLLVSLLLGGSVLINLILFGLLGFIFRLFRLKITPMSASGNSNLRRFSYKELEEATNGFEEELGRGSFGIVYKGLIELGDKLSIAVKKLDRVVSDSEKEFRTEVEVIGQTHHKNLVKLVGFCDEGNHRLLVYTFVSNGTLSNFIFKSKPLDWDQRAQMALGIARGLVYLHEECTTQIIHCDIKPQNILLDENYEAKISDFGLAKLLKLDQTQTFTAIRGTKGYVAPEWFRNIPVTPKVDVYSFGVLLLEIICCRKNVDLELSGEGAILIDWAYDCYTERRIDVLIGKNGEVFDDLEEVERYLKVALWCIQEDSSLRPSMKSTLLMLEGIVKVSAPPCPYPFSVVSG